jgi:acetyl esterase/lipase
MKKYLKLILSSILCLGGLLSASAQTRVITLDNPKLTVFLPPKGLENGKAVIACPGGGYTHLAKDHEGMHWAPFFNNLGVAYAVLEYSLPNGDKTIPMKDVEKAFKVLTDSAEVWKINPDTIGVMGSSAGGHLASTAATHQTAVCKPAFQILFYPVISMDAEITHKGSRNALLGENPSQADVDLYSNEKQVSAATPRAFIALCTDDDVVKADNSIRYYTALLHAGVPASMFVYPKGGHGWGYRTHVNFHDLVLEELALWLKGF